MEPIDVSNWDENARSEPYPEGARSKTLLYSPINPLNELIKPNYPYLFKLSRERCPEQFWVEIFAYRLGHCMNIQVPPTFVAYNSQRNQTAALIEWFYSPDANDIYTSGGLYFTAYIPDFDREKGSQHNFETISQIFEKDSILRLINWKYEWAKILLFDALIGNTDRHQDNWGVVYSFSNESNNGANIIRRARLSPAFDNGTSMGYELSQQSLSKYESIQRITSYVSRGTHQLRWKLTDSKKMGHIEMIEKYVSFYPETRKVMIDCLERVNSTTFESILESLIKFEVSITLSEDRARFMLKLINFRHDQLLSILKG